MNRYGIRIWVMSIFLLISLPLGIGAAEQPADMGGWGIESAYNRNYKNSERDRIKGVIEDIVEITPLSGMSPGVGLIVKDSEGEKVTVHLAPKWYEKEHPSNLRKGDSVKIKGVWAEIEGKEIFMAAKVKWNETEEYKVRMTKDGKPFWAMGPEEHAKETADSETE